MPFAIPISPTGAAWSSEEVRERALHALLPTASELFADGEMQDVSIHDSKALRKFIQSTRARLVEDDFTGSGFRQAPQRCAVGLEGLRAPVGEEEALIGLLDLLAEDERRRDVRSLTESEEACLSPRGRRSAGAGHPPGPARGAR